MSWLKCYGLIVMGNDLIGWILNDFVINNNFKINWFNWCVGCKSIEKPWNILVGNLDSMVLRLKMVKF
jgi:hypothetical protein